MGAAMAKRDRSEQFVPTGIKHADRAEIFSAITGLPIWMDGPKIKERAARDGISYAAAKRVLERAYG